MTVYRDVGDKIRTVSDLKKKRMHVAFSLLKHVEIYFLFLPFDIMMFSDRQLYTSYIIHEFPRWKDKLVSSTSTAFTLTVISGISTAFTWYFLEFSLMIISGFSKDLTWGCFLAFKLSMHSHVFIICIPI